MALNFGLASILFLFTFCFMLLLYYSWQNRETPISVSYGLGVVIAFFYTFGYAFQLLSTTIEQMMFWIHVQYIGIPFGPFIWLIMILQFTGNERFLTKKTIALLSIGPLSTLTTHFTNEWHHLFYKGMSLDYSLGFAHIILDRGPLFYLHIGYAYSYYLVGIVLLVLMYVKSNRERKKQVSLMLTGSLLVFSFPFVHSMKIIDTPIDVSPFGLVFSSVFYLWGIYQFNFMKLSPQAMKKVFESINDAVIIFDIDDHLKIYNKSAHIFFKKSSDKKWIGSSATEVLSHLPPLLQLIEQKSQMDNVTIPSIQLGEKYYKVQFSYINGRGNKRVGKMLIVHDITESILYEESLIQQSKQYEYLAHHDLLTGIYNRTYFEEEVKTRLTQSRKKDGVLMICDLNFFKEINDTYGHLIGDHVLIFTANLWAENLPNPHILARLGGDEFVMFFEGIQSKELFLQQIGAAREAFRVNHFKQNDIEIEVVPSIGIAFVEEDGTDYEHLYHTCDVRMYEDKKNIKAQYGMKKV